MYYVLMIKSLLEYLISREVSNSFTLDLVVYYRLELSKNLLIAFFLFYFDILLIEYKSNISLLLILPI